MPKKDLNINIFIAYSRADNDLLDKLRAHLQVLLRAGIVDNIWYDGMIEIGADWEDSIKRAMHNADLILLLISSDFIASDYCYSNEMSKALELHKEGRVKTIPVILRQSHWQLTPFAKLQLLPKDGVPVEDPGWKTADEPYFQIVDSIKSIVNKIRDEQDDAIAERKKEEKKPEEKKQIETVKPLPDKVKTVKPGHSGIKRWHKLVQDSLKRKVNLPVFWKKWILPLVSIILLGSLGIYGISQILTSKTDISVELEPFTEGEKYGFMDLNGNKVIKAQYTFAEPFSEGLAIVQIKEGENIFIDAKGDQVIPLVFPQATGFSEGLAAVESPEGRDKGRWGYINKKGEFELPPEYYHAFPFSEGLAAVKRSWEEPHGFIGKNGQFIIQPEFDHITQFFINSKAVVWRNGWEYIIDTNGTCLDESSPHGCPKEGMMRDPRDGKEYKTVNINGIEWMAENLSFDDGSEGIHCYEDDQKNCEDVGALYTWDYVFNTEDLCPPRWSIPDVGEIESLLEFAGGGNFSTALNVLASKDFNPLFAGAYFHNPEPGEMTASDPFAELYIRNLEDKYGKLTFEEGYQMKERLLHLWIITYQETSEGSVRKPAKFSFPKFHDEALFEIYHILAPMQDPAGYAFSCRCIKN